MIALDIVSKLNFHLQRDTADQLTAHRSKQTKSQSSHYILLQQNNLPGQQQDDKFILTGYQPVSRSFQELLSSLQHVHNKIVNIYFYLLGTVLFAILPIYVYTRAHNYHVAIQVGDIIGFATFFFRVILCFFLSVSFYTMSNHSKKVAMYWNQFDYLCHSLSQLSSCLASPGWPQCI